MDDQTPETTEADVREERINARVKSDVERLEQDIIKKIEEKSEHQRILAQVDSEMRGEQGQHGALEQILLMSAAAVMIIVLPFIHYLTGILLTIFALVISLAAGLTSPKKSYSPRLNLYVSGAGLLFFEYAAMIQYHTYSVTFLFLLYQILAFIFLFATYFSVITYRHKILE